MWSGSKIKATWHLQIPKHQRKEGAMPHKSFKSGQSNFTEPATNRRRIHPGRRRPPYFPPLVQRLISLSSCTACNIQAILYIYTLSFHFNLSAGELPHYASEHLYHIILPITLKLKCHVVFSTVSSKCYLTLHSIISLYFPPCLISCQYCFGMRNFHLMHQMISVTFKQLAAKIIYLHCCDKIISLLPRSHDMIMTWFSPND